jgi:hypothetical protein
MEVFYSRSGVGAWELRHTFGEASQQDSMYMGLDIPQLPTNFWLRATYDIDKKRYYWAFDPTKTNFSSTFNVPSTNLQVSTLCGVDYKSIKFTGRLKVANLKNVLVLLDADNKQVYSTLNGYNYELLLRLDRGYYDNIVTNNVEYLVFGNDENKFYTAASKNAGTAVNYAVLDNTDIGIKVIYASSLGEYIAIGKKDYATSKDGLTWKKTNVGELEQNEFITHIYEELTEWFLITSSGHIIDTKRKTKTDINLNGGYPTSTAYFYGSTYGTDGTYVYKSTTGRSWSRTPLADVNASGDPKADYIYADSKLLFLSSGIPEKAPYFYYSQDGLEWKKSNSIEPINAICSAPSGVDGSFVVIPANDILFVSEYKQYTAISPPISTAQISSTNAATSITSVNDCFGGWAPVGTSITIPLTDLDVITSSSGAEFRGSAKQGNTTTLNLILQSQESAKIVELTQGAQATNIGTNGKLFKVNDIITINISTFSTMGGWTKINGQYQILSISEPFNSMTVVCPTISSNTVQQVPTATPTSSTAWCGQKWRSISLPVSQRWGRTLVVTSDATFVAASTLGNVIYSTDGVDWKSSTAPAKEYANSFIAFTNGKTEYIILLSRSNSIVVNDKSGVGNWIERQIPLIANWVCGAYGNGMSIILADNTDEFLYSYDLINWQSYRAFNGLWRTMVYGDNTYVALSSTSLAMRSNDGINWTQFQMPIGGVNQVIYANGQYVAVGDGGIAISADAVSWAKVNAPNYSYTAITYGQNRFVAISNNAQLVSSNDNGISWVNASLNNTTTSSLLWSNLMYSNGTSLIPPRFIAMPFEGITAQVAACELAINTAGSTIMLPGQKSMATPSKLVPYNNPVQSNPLIPGQQTSLIVSYPLYNGQSLTAYQSEAVTVGPFKVTGSGYSPDSILAVKLEAVDQSISELFPNSNTTANFTLKTGFSFLLKPAVIGRIGFKVKVYDPSSSTATSNDIIINMNVRASLTDTSVKPPAPVTAITVRNTARLPYQDPVYELIGIKAFFNLSGVFGNEIPGSTWPPVYDDPRIIYPGRYTFEVGFSGMVPDNLVGKKVTVDLAYCIFPEIDSLDNYWKNLQKECRARGGIFEEYFDLSTNTRGYRNNFPSLNNARSSTIPACQKLLDLKSKLLSKELYKTVDADNNVKYLYNGPNGYYYDQNYLSIDQIKTGIEICINKAFPNESPIIYVEFEPTFDIATKRRSRNQSLIRIPGFRLNIEGQEYPNNTTGLKIQINNVSQALGFITASGSTGSHFCPDRMIIGCNKSYSPNPLDKLSNGTFNLAQYKDTNLSPPTVVNNNLDTDVITKLFTTVPVTGSAFDTSKPTIEASVKPNVCQPGILGRTDTSITELVKLMNSKCNVSSNNASDAVPVYYFNASGALGAVINTANNSRKEKFSVEFINSTLTGRIELSITNQYFISAFGLKYNSAGNDQRPYLCADGSSAVANYYAELLKTGALRDWGYTYAQTTKKFIPSKTVITNPQLNNVDTYRGGIIATGISLKNANYIGFSDLMLDVSKHNCEDMAYKVSLPANQYRIIISDTKSRIDGYYKSDLKVLYQYNEKIAIKSLITEGAFKSMADASARYRGKGIEFVHDGGEIRIWIPVKQPKVSSGVINISIEKAESFKSDVLIIDSNKIHRMKLTETMQVRNEIGDIYFIIDIKDGNDTFKVALPSLDGNTIIMPKVSKFRFQRKDYHLGQSDTYWPLT